MSDVPVLKKFVTYRYEYWVPTGGYEDRGAYWTDLTMAISRATNKLKEAGLVSESWTDAASDQITIHPHDEHVIVRFSIEEEVKDGPETHHQGDERRP